MSRKIYTYSSINKLHETAGFEEFRYYPHITATSDLAHAVSQKYNEQIDKVIDINKLIRSMLKEWNSETDNFQMYLNMSSILRKMMEDAGEVDKKIFIGFRRNLSDVLKSVKTLVEADIYPDDIRAVTQEEKIFKSLWERIEKESKEILNFRYTMKLIWNDRDEFLKVLNEAQGIGNADTVVMNGFYFITPVQERIMDLMESNGINIIFLNCYDSRYPKSFEIWSDNFSKDRGYINEDWKKKSSENESSKDKDDENVFGQYFENGCVQDKPQNVKIVEYKNDIEFAMDVKRIEDEGFTLYTSDKKSAEDILKDFYPEKFEKRHLLSYPVGQYIYYLHKMWDGYKHELVLDMEGIRNCFASGWLSAGGVNAKQYVYDLEKIQIYFKDCKTVQDWKSRLEKLKSAVEEIKPFEDRINGIKTKEKRWHELMGNPFLKFSIFEDGIDRIEDTVNLIEELIKVSEGLFCGDKEIDLFEHLRNIREILTAHGNMDSTYAEEKIIMDELLKRLDTDGKRNFDCFPEDISDAVMLLIGGGFVDKDSMEFQTGDYKSMVKPIYQIEASSILNEDGKIHMCLCDEDRMPGSIKKYSWPLTDDMIDRLDIKDRKDALRYIGNMKFIREKSILCNRYLFYILLENKEVELSWISQAETKKTGMSPYAEVMKLDKKSSPMDLKIDAEYIDSIDTGESGKMAVLHPDMKSNIPREVKMDYLMCSYKYLYGYVLNKYPSYNSDFQYSFLISRLITILRNIPNAGDDTIINEVMNLFPYLRGIEKRQIIDYAGGRNEECTSEEFENVLYTNERLKLHFIPGNILNKAENAYNDWSHDIQIVDDDDDKLNLCMYCFHRNYCIKTKYAVDMGE